MQMIDINLYDSHKFDNILLIYLIKLFHVAKLWHSEKNDKFLEHDKSKLAPQTIK